MKFVVCAITASEPSYAQAAASRLEELGYSPRIVSTEEWLRVAVLSTSDPVEADAEVIELRSKGFRGAMALAEGGREEIEREAF